MPTKFLYALGLLLCWSTIASSNERSGHGCAPLSGTQVMEKAQALDTQATGKVPAPETAATTLTGSGEENVTFIKFMYI